MALPEELITLAIVGTEKSGHLVPQVATPLQHLLDQVDTIPERQMLLTIAGLDLRQRAGRLAPHADRLTIAQAPTDTQPAIGRIALRHLYLMLKGIHKESLGEWLREVAASGQRVPEEAIPSLLELGKQNKAFRADILKLIGERGKWLAREVTTRDWVWFEARNFDRRWKQGSLETRLELLEFILPNERARVRELLAESWAKEKVETKVAFIQLLLKDLTLDDEVFLEQCLDDSQPEVRYQAAILLTQLEGSVYQKRAIERLRPLIHKKSNLLGGGFTINPPAQWVAQWERDAVIETADLDILLAQLIGYTLPQHLCELLGIDLITLFKWCTAPKQNTWFSVNIFPRWVTYHGCGLNEWLIQNLLTKLDEPKLSLLLEHTSHTVLARELPEFINRLTPRQIRMLMARFQGNWDARLSLTFTDWVKQIIPENPVTSTVNDVRATRDYFGVIAMLVPQIAHQISLEHGEAFCRAIPQNKLYWEEDSVEVCRGILDFRREMLDAIHATQKDK